MQLIKADISDPTKIINIRYISYSCSTDGSFFLGTVGQSWLLHSHNHETLIFETLNNFSPTQVGPVF